MFMAPNPFEEASAADEAASPAKVKKEPKSKAPNLFEEAAQV